MRVLYLYNTYLVCFPTKGTTRDCMIEIYFKFNVLLFTYTSVLLPLITNSYFYLSDTNVSYFI